MKTRAKPKLHCKSFIGTYDYGLVVESEDKLLFDENVSSSQERRNVISAVAYGFAVSLSIFGFKTRDKEDLKSIYNSY